MVKKMRITYLLKAIKKNGVSFFAVALIAATSIAIYLGIQSGAVTILEHTDDYFRQQRLASMEVVCANGITQEDIQALAALPEVDAVEGGYQATVLAAGEQENLIIQARSLYRELNQPVIVEGELPENADEVAIEEKYAQHQHLALGDRIHITHQGELLYDTFTVTAIVNDPVYTCLDVVDARGKGEVGFGSVSYYIELPEEAFDGAYFDNCFTTAYLENKALSALDFYSEEYTQAEASLRRALEQFGAERAQLRYTSLLERLTLKVEEAGQALEGAMLDTQGIQQENWILFGRNSIGDVSGVESIVQGLFTLSYSFALIFLLVAVVVCYAAVVKLIDDQKALIGTQKALGFRTKEIFAHYLIYNLLCALLGIAIGYAGGVLIVENLVIYVFSVEFSYASIPLGFAWKEAGAVAVLCLVIFVAATFAGCLKTVRQSAVSLLRGEAPTQKKAYFFESWGIYKKLSLYSRTMVKNILLDKGRILITIMGVVGCMSLLMITFTLKNSISNSTDMQFKDYYLYENRLAIDSTAGDAAAFEEVLDSEGIPYVRIQDKLQNYRAGGQEWGAMRVIALTGEENLDGFIYFEDIETGQAAQIPEEGVLVSRKCAENNDLKAGSTIELMDASGNPRTCLVAGVIEHYLPYHQIVTSAAYYESVLDENVDDCIFLLKGDIAGLYEKVRDMDGFMSLKDNSEYKDPFTSFNLVIGICVIFSAVLAVLVLLNQMMMYINRKTIELSVMRINGYTIKETKTFISRDNILLISVGLILGCLVGTPLAQMEVIIIESGPARYIRTPNGFACVFAGAVCILFSLVVNQIALRKIKHLRLTNINGN